MSRLGKVFEVSCRRSERKEVHKFKGKREYIEKQINFEHTQSFTMLNSMYLKIAVFGFNKESKIVPSRLSLVCRRCANRPGAVAPYIASEQSHTRLSTPENWRRIAVKKTSQAASPAAATNQVEPFSFVLFKINLLPDSEPNLNFSGKIKSLR